MHFLRLGSTKRLQQTKHTRFKRPKRAELSAEFLCAF